MNGTLSSRLALQPRIEEIPTARPARDDSYKLMGLQEPWL